MKKDRLELNICKLNGEVVDYVLTTRLGPRKLLATYFWLDVSKIREFGGERHLFAFRIYVRVVDNVAAYCKQRIGKGMMVRVEGELYEEHDECGSFLALHARRVIPLKEFNEAQP